MSLALIVATILFGAEVKGSRRWITIASVSIQASEFAKPAFVVLVAWLFSESARRPEMPATLMSLGLLLSLVTLLVAQPDFGQTMLVLLVWGALFFMAGMRFIWIFGLGAIGLVGLFSAYKLVPHVAGRIKRFMDPASGDTFQVDTAIESFLPAAGSGAVRAKAPSSASCRTAIRTSSSPSQPRNSASSFVWRSWRCSPFIVIRALSHALKTEDLFTRLRRRALRSCSARNRPSTWRSICISFPPRDDVAVHFLWRLLDDLARLRHGMLLALTRERPAVETQSAGDLYFARGAA